MIDSVAPSPVIEYIALAISVTHVTPSERFSPSRTMAAVTTGVSLGSTGVVSPRCPTTAVEASGPQVDGSTSFLCESAAPVQNIIEPQIGDLGFHKYGNSCADIRIGSGINFFDKVRVLYSSEDRARWDSGRWIQCCDFVVANAGNYDRGRCMYERVQQQTVEVPMPQILKETVEEGCTVKQMVDIFSVEQKKAELVDIARCFGELKRQSAEMGMQHPMTTVGGVELP